MCVKTPTVSVFRTDALYSCASQHTDVQISGRCVPDTTGCSPGRTRCELSLTDGRVSPVQGSFELRKVICSADVGSARVLERRRFCVYVRPRAAESVSHGGSQGEFAQIQIDVEFCRNQGQEWKGCWKANQNVRTCSVRIRHDSKTQKQPSFLFEKVQKWTSRSPLFRCLKIEQPSTWCDLLKSPENEANFEQSEFELPKFGPGGVRPVHSSSCGISGVRHLCAW